ncbi:DUF885 domain-containing protein [Galactobacter caseinivorans]|uniref:DUF885 domain-containing protein n=1 Tax=Galactobacter caseinivorans TaxID=2676123 RepID=A0A496PJK9_9MICC|nr:DUF885 domain-containing protein [Galactobacter caseinivorans]RKW70684.1 DUF885 domain-containing protein [Galactobacter caseinivorans]
MTQTTQRTPSAIDALANRYVEQLVKLDPELATDLGIPGAEEEYADHSPAGVAARRALLATTLAALDQEEPTDEVDRVTADVLRERLGLSLEIIDSGVTPLNNIESVPQSSRGILDLMPTDTHEQWGHIAGRLSHLPGALSGYRESLEASRAAGKVAAARQVTEVASQCGAYAEAGGYFDQLLTQAPSDNPQLTSRLAEGAAAAKAAYADLASYLTEDLIKDAPSKDAVGREYYSLMSREFLGAEVDLEETYAWGVAELDRIIAEQEAVAEEIEPGASVERAREILNADPARELHGTDALKAWMQDKSDTALRELAGSHFEIVPPMDRLECMIAPTQEGGIYYTAPSSDFSRPGRMWWSVPEGEDVFRTWAETSTVYHEGAPGHHLQIATALLAGGLNRFRTELVWVSGHGEGWALYAERLMEELGYLADPGDRLGMLDGQRLRAARVVFDIGVHLELEVPPRWGEGTWDADKGWDFLTRNVFESEGRVRFEFLRYLGWPGQAPSYKIGQRLWEQIREEVRTREGQAFNEREFHTRALRLGSMGLDSLRRALLGG